HQNKPSSKSRSIQNPSSQVAHEILQALERFPSFPHRIPGPLSQLRGPRPPLPPLLPRGLHQKPRHVIGVGHRLGPFPRPNRHSQLLHQQLRVQVLVGPHWPRQHRHPGRDALERRVPPAV
ncbi:obp3-responsive gene 1, partial [Striga asiatica]